MPCPEHSRGHRLPSRSSHASPSHPGSQKHLPAVHTPCSSHPSGHCGSSARSTSSICEQSSPRNPVSHTHKPWSHTPCELQFAGHSSCRPQSSPANPGSHTHLPPWHMPAPLHGSPPSTATGHASEVPQSSPEYPGAHTHSPRWHTPLRPLQSFGHCLRCEQSSPLYPVAHTQRPRKHSPCSPHPPSSPGQLSVSSHASPVNPRSHWHTAAPAAFVMHVPWLWHLCGHMASHANPPYSGSHVHRPVCPSHSPWLEHSVASVPSPSTWPLGQLRCEQSWPSNPDSHRHWLSDTHRPCPLHPFTCSQLNDSEQSGPVSPSSHAHSPVSVSHSPLPEQSPGHRCCAHESPCQPSSHLHACDSHVPCPLHASASLSPSRHRTSVAQSSPPQFVKHVHAIFSCAASYAHSPCSSLAVQFPGQFESILPQSSPAYPAKQPHLPVSVSHTP
mmetsp:Transcript_29714/g.97216  ORF Transcript_29714/g.97216 Transcript_29714/m.97216 type:complete len:444 (+) Transcript_29714:1754-3085(+)